MARIETVLAVELADARRHLARRPLARRLLEQRLLFGEIEDITRAAYPECVPQHGDTKHADYEAIFFQTNASCLCARVE